MVDIYKVAKYDECKCEYKPIDSLYHLALKTAASNRNTFFPIGSAKDSGFGAWTGTYTNEYGFSAGFVNYGGFIGGDYGRCAELVVAPAFDIDLSKDVVIEEL